MYFIFNSIFTSDADVTNRIIARMESIRNVFENGLRSDESMNIRLESYFHFISNMNNLGVGTHKLSNYYIYSSNFNSNDMLMFQNPHSLIVEIGYWLGYPGLITFFGALVFLIVQNKVRLFFLVVIFISMFISSSVLISPLYFFFLFLCIVLSRIKNVKVECIGKTI